ncbi:hypothetical protein RYX36_019104 [Vicia faba]
MAFRSKSTTFPKEVTVLVIGDKSTGKSTLISAMASDSFSSTVPPMLPPTRLPPNSFTDSTPLVVIDTPSSVVQQGKLSEELKRADSVVVTYACDDSVSFERVSSYWLPELQKLEVKAPVLVVGCKLDLRNERMQVSLASLTTGIMNQFKEVVTCIECSAATLYQVPEVFYFAQKSALHPVDPLFDYDSNALTDRCVRALRRIFNLFDFNLDGIFTDRDLYEFQTRSFGAELLQSDIDQIKTMVEQNVPEGVNSHGLTFRGFIEIHNMFLKKGRPETFWAVLRKFGYGNDLKLRDDFLPVPSKASDQSVELSGAAIEFLKGVFRLLDTDKDQLLRPAEIDKLFDAAPESPWKDAPYKDAAETTEMGSITLNGFLSQWALMTLLDPKYSLANLIYIGCKLKPAAALRVTPRRSEERKKKKTERNVFQCYVFGSKNAGKSAFLFSLLGRSFSDFYTPTTVEQYAANNIELTKGTKKTLILREIPEDEVSSFLSKKDCLAACDVAAFVHDSSDGYSWKKSIDLLEKVVNQGELTGHKFPCLLIAAKDDLAPFPRAVLDSYKVAQELKIDAPIRVSMRSGDSNDVYSKIVNAAEHPHLSIPETEFVRKRKQQQQLLHSFIFALAGAAMAFACLTVRRVRANKNSS